MKVLKLSSGGVPQSWISLQDAVTLYAAGDVRWEAGSEIACFRGGHNAITGLQSQIVVSSIIGTRGKPCVDPFAMRMALTGQPKPQ